jgi:hypothetical protein
VGYDERMWGRICILTFWGALSFGADVCSGLPTPNSRLLSVPSTDKPRPASFRLRVKSGGPEFRITLRPPPFGDLPDPGHFDIEVARCKDAVLLQVLPIFEDGPGNFDAAFWASDINFDGYLDFSVMTALGGREQSWWSWIYDPRSGRFVQNELTAQLHGMGSPNGSGRPGGLDIDPEKHEITYTYLPSRAIVCSDVFQQGGREVLVDVERYRVDNNRLILIHQEKATFGDGTCTVTVSDLIGESMVVTSVRNGKMVDQ